MTSTTKKPVALIILDGFGYSESTRFNAIANADTPVWSKLWQTAPKTLITTSGLAVGLPDGQMGNSEVGHMTLGAGRVVYQNFTRINKAIEDGDFFTNPVYTTAVDQAVQAGKAVHVMGLLSSGGVHSHEDHILAMLQLAAGRGAKNLYLHAFLDGRDTPPRSAESSLAKAEAKLAELGTGKIASVIGRYYAMDRDKRWDRVQTAYDLLVEGEAGCTAETAQEALAAAYARGENDEFVQATVIRNNDGAPVKMADGDAVIFMNFRPDRARQISHALADQDFDGLTRRRVPKLGALVMTTEYSSDLHIPCAFPPTDLSNTYGEVIAKNHMTQLRIAETEKYAHVTFFFSGGQEATYEGEERILIPSPKVATYDLQPEMSAPEMTDRLVEAIKSGQFDTIICNYANCDMVGHSGSFEAAIKAVEAVDACIGRVEEALRSVGGEALITADHGNVEEMFDETSDQLHTQHTTLPVPLVYVGHRQLTLADGGSLADIAPSLLTLLNVKQPQEMQGRSLVELH